MGVGFQIDATQINVEAWIGKKFTVEMGQVNRNNLVSMSNIFDLNGNPIEWNVEFQKTFAQINLDQASTSFTVTLANLTLCSDMGSAVCAGEIKDSISSLIGMSADDRDRIDVSNVTSLSSGGDPLSATIKILPTTVDDSSTTSSSSGVGGSLRKLREALTSSGSDSSHSVGLFRKLQKEVENIQHQDEESASLKGRKLAIGQNAMSAGVNIVALRNMRILPSDFDKKLFVADPDLVEEEEDIKQYALMTNNARLIGQTSLNKVDRKMMIEKIESMSKVEDALFRELKESREKSQSELNVLHIELAVVTLACVGISLAAFFSLKR